MIRQIASAIAVGALCVGLAGCDGNVLPHNDPSDPDRNPGGWVGVTDVNVHGRTVPCVTWKNGYAGGISCDFASAK